LAALSLPAESAPQVLGPLAAAAGRQARGDALQVGLHAAAHESSLQLPGGGGHACAYVTPPTKSGALRFCLPCERCRFCNSTLADWKASLTPDPLKPEVQNVQPIMVVYFEGEIHR
jgi:hypothetical protein